MRLALVLEHVGGNRSLSQVEVRNAPGEVRRQTATGTIRDVSISGDLRINTESPGPLVSTRTGGTEG